MATKENIFKRMKSYLTDVKGEVKKVNWPTKNDLIKTTIAVIVSSLVFGIYLFIIDYGFRRFFQVIIDLFKKG